MPHSPNHLAPPDALNDLHRLLDGSLPPQRAAALNQRLATDPTFAAAFAAASLQAALIEEHLDTKATETSKQQTTAAPVSPEGAPIYRKGYEPQPARFRPAHYAFAAIAATLLAACGVAIYAYFASLPQSEIPDPTSPSPGPPVATLIHNTGGGDLRTPHGFPAEGDDYGRGEYALSSGTAEFMLTNAVNVKLRGQSHMVMHHDMAVSLTRGSAKFVCPKDAKGFTVTLPGGLKVIDLGTAFEIDIDDNGDAAIRVTGGLVKLVTAGDETNPPREIMLTEAMSINVSDRGRTAGPIVTKIKPASYTYVSELRPATENPGYDDSGNELIDGKIGDNRYIDPNWVGVIDRAKDPRKPHPSVLFDLGEARSVVTIKFIYLVDHEGGIHAPSRATIALGDTADSLSEPTEYTGFDDAPDPTEIAIGDVREHVIRFAPSHARFFRIDLYNIDEWTFISEIEFESITPLHRQEPPPDGEPSETRPAPSND